MGKRLLNFQITWCVLMFLIYALILSAGIFHLPIPFLRGNIGGIEIILIVVPFMYLINILLIIFNAYRSAKGSVVYYKPALRILK